MPAAMNGHTTWSPASHAAVSTPRARSTVARRLEAVGHGTSRASEPEPEPEPSCIAEASGCRSCSRFAAFSPNALNSSGLRRSRPDRSRRLLRPRPPAPRRARATLRPRMVAAAMLNPPATAMRPARCPSEGRAAMTASVAPCTTAPTIGTPLRRSARKLLSVIVGPLHQLRLLGQAEHPRRGLAQRVAWFGQGAIPSAVSSPISMLSSCPDSEQSEFHSFDMCGCRVQKML